MSIGFVQAQMPEGKRWDAYLGRFDVIRLVITDFLEGRTCVDELLAYLTEKVWDELKEAYPEIHGRDDVLSLLVHLGYLGYDAGRGEVFISTCEILEAFRTSTNAVNRIRDLCNLTPANDNGEI